MVSLTGIVPSPEHYVTIFKAWRHGATEANKLGLLSGGGSDDPEGISALNAEGKEQAKALGKLISESGPLDAIYSSDLRRTVATAETVLTAFREKGQEIEFRTSKQLREILHGAFELSDAKTRNEKGMERIQNMLSKDQNNGTEDAELKDKYRFWKIHPLVEKHEVVPEIIVNVEDYLSRGERRPETPYQLWQRLHQEFIKIAKAHPGGSVGVSLHGACLSTLLNGLNPNLKGGYLPPHYSAREFKHGDEVVVPACPKIANCALIHFKYDSRTGKLELFNP